MNAASTRCQDVVRAQGFCFVQAAAMRAALSAIGALGDWAAFAASWESLAPDRYLEKTGRFRRRRHAVFVATSDGRLTREAHQPHFQSVAYNPLQGDLERWFEPVPDAVASGESMQTILRYAVGFFASLAPEVRRWRMEVHQFRIEARADAPGEPTPEGVHRDGVDFVLVVLVARQNIASGTTRIHGADGVELGSFTLMESLDAALVDDGRVFHGVTPVTAMDGCQASHRDVLVVTLKRFG
jgi:hypothetical protein